MLSEIPFFGTAKNSISLNRLKPIIKETSLTMNEASSKYNPVNDSQNIFYRKAFKNGIDFTKRQFSKNLSVKN